MSALEKLILAAGLLVLAALGIHQYGLEQYGEGYDAAVEARAGADALAVAKRADDNKVVAAQQTQINTDISKEKYNEIADLRRRLAAADRLRVGTAVCPGRPAAPAQAESAAGGDSADPPAGLVSEAADRNFKQLILEVEQDLATARACQAFLDKNGMVP